MPLGKGLYTYTEIIIILTYMILSLNVSFSYYFLAPFRALFLLFLQFEVLGCSADADHTPEVFWFFFFSVQEVFFKLSVTSGRIPIRLCAMCPSIEGISHLNELI